MAEDRNFDDLAERFVQRISQGEKGQWRRQLLQQDLQPLAQGPALQVWDVGCGEGHLSLWLAQQGHQLTLCDLSARLLAVAKAQFAEAQLSAAFLHASAQTLAPQLPAMDLVLCHAVLEWLAEPMPTLEIIAQKVKPGGYLSLMFYNRNAMVLKNVLRGGWRLEPILNDRYLGQGNKLSPPNPQYPQVVIEQLQNWGFECQQRTGIRVFVDYLSSQARAESNPETLYALEAQYCRHPDFWAMGRYVHLLLQRQS